MGQTLDNQVKWAVFGVFVNGLAVLAAVGAGGVAYLQYRSSLAGDNVRQTIEFLKMSYTERLGPKNERLWQTIYLQQNDLVNKIQENARKRPAKERSMEYATMITKFVDHNKLRNDLITVYGFYEQVATCVNADICDTKATKVIFGGTMRTFANWFGPILEDIERSSGNKYEDTEFKKFVDHQLQ